MPHSLRPSLPDDVLYSKLLEVASQQGDRIIVDDRSRNTQFGYLDILNGVATLQQQLTDLIDPSTLAEPGEFFIALLAPNGYEFIVGVLATLAIGGVVVPVPIGALPAEISHIIRHCAAQVLLIGPEEHSLAVEIAAQVPNITSLAIRGQSTDPSTLPPATHYILDATLALPAETPSILFFTSGTTGPPKGVLHARRTINKYALAASSSATAEAQDEICLIPRGTFWSIYFTKLFQMLLLGVRIEIQNFGRNYGLIWEKFRQKSATKIVLSPTFWYGMMVHYKAHIATLQDEGQRAEYVEGLRYLRNVHVTGAMPSARLKDFWRVLRGGRPLRVLYGTTETQEIAVAREDEYSEEADLGTALPGVTIKLSGGEQGEVLVKTPSLFLRYLHAPEDSAQKFDADGFFKTGDFAVRQNDRIVFKGRANMDLFKFYTYKVPRLVVESRLLALPYLTEGYVLPIQDPQCDSRVAVLVRTNDKADKVDLGKIRTDLSVQLPAYQLPTVLRVLKDHETVPRTWSDKTAMAKAINLFFPQDVDQNVVGADVEVMDIGNFMKAKTQKMWDLSGMR